METESVVPKKIIPDQADATLDDEKGTQEGHFVGATLEIDETAPNDNNPDVEFRGAGLSRNRPGSTIGRQSVRSTTSRTSMRPGYIKTEYESKTFFSYKESAFDCAVRLCKKEIVPDIDGEMQGAWLLTEIDHWDIEREKMVFLCENSMLIFRYNFITSKVEYWKRVVLHIIDTIFVGDFVYPNYSIMPAREHGGVKICWNNGEMPSFGQRWNPICTTIPWAIFSHHPLLYNPKENETVTYNVDEFYESLIQQVSKVYSDKRPEEKVTVVEGPIVIESYANVASMVYNQSSVGFCRDRNGVSF
ncbi:hypothetical protein ACJMK2_008186 [Sinanodonta woodiana]|uniref:HSac2 domain-containing protein n=1 Tax=Sinanodonta woodiana TaxID=1069815 RepID=A0ABD3VKT8_SINWO